MLKKALLIISFCSLSMMTLQAEDRLELETTFIKGNKELPQILYLVPWKNTKTKVKREQQIVLYSLFGDLFEPINPDELGYKIISN